MKKVPKLRFKEFTGEWEEKKLGECIDYKKGYAFKAIDYVESGIRIVRVSDLGEHSIKEENKIYISDKKYSTYKDWEIYPNDILVTTVGSRPPLYSSMVGKIILVPEILEKSFLNQNNVLLRSKKNFSQKFIYNSFFRKKYISYIENIARGNANQANITLKDFFEYRINVPFKLQEQEKIANFLSSVDKKISLTEEKLELFKNYKKGIMQKIFSQKLKFKDENGNDYPEWEEKKLGEIGEFFSGGTPLTSKKEYYDGKIPFIKSGEISLKKTEQFISKEGLKNSSAKLVKKEDLLFALYGATSGEVAISKMNGAINQAVLCIKTTENSRFLYNYFKLKKENILKKYLQGGQGNLSAEIIKKLQIYFPSLKEQEKIANFLSSIDEKIEKIENELENLKEFKKGLLQRLFV